MDPALRHIVKAVAGGAVMPNLGLVISGGGSIFGTPVPATKFVELVEPSLQSVVEKSLKDRPRKERKDDPGDAVAITAQVLAQVDFGDAAYETITLECARMFWSGRADGAELPVLRVPLAAVVSWWFAGTGREVRASGGSGLGFGVAFPLRS